MKECKNCYFHLNKNIIGEGIGTSRYIVFKYKEKNIVCKRDINMCVYDCKDFIISLNYKIKLLEKYL